MPIYDLKCIKCEATKEAILRGEEADQPIRCDVCQDGVMEKQMSLFGSYRITGNNSASVTPKKFRGGRRA
jgi:putative FmdB family regulatory protein